MSVRTWCSLLVACALFGSCEPRTVEIEGLDELTAEIRSQRLLNRQRTAAGGESASDAAEVRGSQIKSAMAPLRDVLTQLGTSQRELSTRQATLTQEMRRWTQLLVQSMQSDRSDEATKLSERLAALEKTISEQDKRHRLVEELLGSALDHTADQLEQFLIQVGAASGATTPGARNPSSGGPESGASPPPTNPNGKREGDGSRDPATAPNSANAPNKAGGTLDPTRGDAPSDPASMDEKAAAGQPPGGTTPASAGQPDNADGKEASKQGSVLWLWGLAVMSLLSGFVLLFRKKQSRPLAMAPEMQYAPPQQHTDDAQPRPQTFTETHTSPTGMAGDQRVISKFAVGNSVVADLAIGDLPPAESPLGDSSIGSQTDSISATGDDQTDSPQVDELWAAAALLGEAIGRLKQTGEPIPAEFGAQLVPEQTDPQPANTSPCVPDRDEVAPDDFFVVEDAVEEDVEIDATRFAEPDSLPSPDSLAGPPLNIAATTDAELHAVQALGLPSPDREPIASESTLVPVATADGDGVVAGNVEADAVVTDGSESPAGPNEIQNPSPSHAPEPNTVIAAPPQEVTIPAASGQPAARHASLSPITCRLFLAGNEQTEGRVRSILGRDPRVLVSPAPQVRTGMGELEVSFALLPGLTAGERSLLEQQLRDTVA